MLSLEKLDITFMLLFTSTRWHHSTHFATKTPAQVNFKVINHLRKTPEMQKKLFFSAEFMHQQYCIFYSLFIFMITILIHFFFFFCLSAPQYIENGTDALIYFLSSLLKDYP